MSDETVFECPECHGAMHLDEDKLLLVCPFCGAQRALDETTAERLNSLDDKEVELAHIDYLKKKADLEAEAQKRAESRKARQDVANGAKNTVKKIACVIGVIIAVLVGISVVISALDEADYQQRQKDKLTATLEWPTSGLATHIPTPSATKGTIQSNTSTDFSVDVSSDGFDGVAYIEACKAAGYTIDPDTTSSRYEAYNAEGYKVSIWIYSSSAEIDIDVSAPKTLQAISWPSSGLASLVPVPPSLEGYGLSDREDSFSVYVGNITREQWSSYVDDCINAGFNVDYRRANDSFYGKNADGVTLDVDYEGYNTIRVWAYRAS